MTKQFVYIEDRSLDTGHGWRDVDPSELRIAHSFQGKDHDFIIKVEGKPWVRAYEGCSYFWITGKEYFEQNGHLEDNVRTGGVVAGHPGFLGHDTMESHFEFQNMNPVEVRRHLEAVGIAKGAEPWTD